MKPTKNFQIRWNEPLGIAECPYAYRYVFIFFGYSIRVHRWLRSDDKRFMHNHPWWFVTFVLRGSYQDISLNEIEQLNTFSFKYRNSNHTHYVEIPDSGCLTLLITGKPINKWGFWIKERYLRPLRFFSRYGHPPCNEQ